MLCPPGARWHPEEEKNDPEFAKQLAEGCDIYVNDAFGTAHRAHASTAGGLPCGVSLEARACTGQVPPNALECTGCATWCCPSGVPIHCCPMLLTCCPAASAAAGVASYLSPKVSGFLMKKELDYLGGWVGGPPGWIVVCFAGRGKAWEWRLGDRLAGAQQLSRIHPALPCCPHCFCSGRREQPHQAFCRHRGRLQG